MSSETRKGEIYIIVEALLWSLYPILTILTLRTIPPLIALALTSTIAFLFFASVATYRNTWRGLHLEKNLLEAVAAATLLALGFSLVFVGLQYTTAGNAGLIGLLEFFFSYIFFNLIKGETFSKKETLGAVFMVLGASLIFLPDVLSHATINKGDLLIVLAVTFAPFINYFQRKAREGARSETVLMIRTAIGVPIMIAISFAMGETTTLNNIYTALPYILASGVFVFGLSKILWLEGIARIPITKAVALASIVPLSTLFFAFIVLNQEPTPFQIISFVPLFIGVLLLTRKARK
jgi:drug/metabolite transporter (DMT)-like permease